MKILITSVLMLGGLNAFGKSIDKLNCSGQFRPDPSKQVYLSYPIGRSSEEPVIYCDASDGYWHSCAMSFYLRQITETGSMVFIGGPNTYSDTGPNNLVPANSSCKAGVI